VGKSQFAIEFRLKKSLVLGKCEYVGNLGRTLNVNSCSNKFNTISLIALCYVASIKQSLTRAKSAWKPVIYSWIAIAFCTRSTNAWARGWLYLWGN